MVLKTSDRHKQCFQQRRFSERLKLFICKNLVIFDFAYNKSRTLASNAGYGDETCIPLEFAWLMAQSVLEQSRQDFCYAIA